MFFCFIYQLEHQVRSQRGREEWESATLQNTNTKCNGLLPMWGPQVTEFAYAACLARLLSVKTFRINNQVLIIQLLDVASTFELKLLVRLSLGLEYNLT